MISTIANDTLRIAYTPDPDDAFAWWAIATEQIAVPDCKVVCETQHIQQINEQCLRGELDVAAISSAAWPFFCKDYVLLSPGASVGRNYGPVLAAKNSMNLEDLSGTTVAIPGKLTTATMLLRLFFPGVITIEMPFDQIAENIANDTVAAGVLIHEELLNWENAGIRQLVSLGGLWAEATNLPIPVGLNVAHRRLGEAKITQIATAIRDSVRHAQIRRRQAIDWALQYSITSQRIAEKFINMFANEDTLQLAPDCIEALRIMYSKAFDQQLIPVVPYLDPVMPESRSLCKV